MITRIAMRRWLLMYENNLRNIMASAAFNNAKACVKIVVSHGEKRVVPKGYRMRGSQFNWQRGNDHCDMVLAGSIAYSRYENILGNTLAVANNRI